MSRRLLVSMSLSALVLLTSSAAATGAVHDCRTQAANIAITSVRDMTCTAAKRDMLLSLHRCCRSRFQSQGGFTCFTRRSGLGRCVRGNRAYRFTVYE